MAASSKRSPETCKRYEKATELLGKRWTGLILFQLLDGAKRYGELASGMDISDRVLSERLKELEAEGILERTVEPGPPVRVSYALSKKGAALYKVVDEIGRWADRWIELDAAEAAALRQAHEK
jgi:DNA-binding HxlR family transcriptional regulator